MLLKLAEAKPNWEYMYHNNLENVILCAYYSTRKKKLIFAEEHTDDPDYRKSMDESIVHDIFSRGLTKKEKPFLVNNNKLFVSCLLRNINKSASKKYKRLKRKALKKYQKTKRKINKGS